MKAQVYTVLLASILLPLFCFGQFKSDYQVDYNSKGVTKKEHHDVSISYAEKGAPPMQYINGNLVSSGIFMFNYNELGYNPIQCKMLYKDEKTYDNYEQKNFEITGDWALNFSTLKVKIYRDVAIKADTGWYSFVFTLYRTASFGGGYITFYANTGNMANPKNSDKTDNTNSNFDSANIYIDRGNLKLKEKDPKGAVEDFTKAIEFSPKSSVAYYRRGLAKDDLKDFQAAIEDFTQAIKYDPQPIDAFLCRGLAKNSLKDYQGAIEDYNIVMRIKPNDTEPYELRQEAKRNMKDYAGAIADCDQMLKLNPNWGWAYYYRGEIKMIIGEKDSGCSDFKKAIDLGIKMADSTLKKYCQ